MEKIIFFSLVIPIFAFVLFLGGRAIMNGFSAKEANRSEKEELEEQDYIENSTHENNNLSDELAKLNELREKGILTQEEFDKAKNKLLNQ
jgi:predicted Zn-dependent peptidase